MLVLSDWNFGMNIACIIVVRYYVSYGLFHFTKGDVVL